MCNLGFMYLRVRGLRGGYRRRVGMEVYMAVERKGLNITTGLKIYNASSNMKDGIQFNTNLAIKGQDK